MLTDLAPPTTSRLSRRPSSDADAPLLRRLFAESRADLDLLPNGVRDQVLDLQLHAQRRQQEADHPGCRREILLYDGAPVGLLVTDRDADSVHVLDIAIAAAHRGRGLGTAVLNELRAENITVVLQVWADNAGARRLYQRLGFTYDESTHDESTHDERTYDERTQPPPNAGHLQMRWRPTRPDQTRPDPTRPDQEG